MFSFYKKHIIIAVLVYFSIVLMSSSVWAATIILDGKDDAGIYPTQTAFAEFVIAGYPSVPVDPSYQPWSNRADVNAYVSAYNAFYPNSIPYWNRVQSAGNIRSSDTVVGESLSGLSAGTYRISPYNDGVHQAFEYEFDWDDPADPEYVHRYWWKVYIKASNVYINGMLEQEHYYILGQDQNLNVSPAFDASYAQPEDYDYYAAHSSYDCGNDCNLNAAAAFTAVSNNYINISLAQGGELSFWIWDWNSIDNSGGISVNVEPVPEPSTLVLLTMGLIFLIYRKHRNRLGLRAIGIAPKENKKQV